MNDYLMPDLQSMKMVLESMGGKNYKIIRQEIYDFNDFGRAVPIRTEQVIFGVLSKQNTKLNISNEGNGEWLNADYEFSIIYPEVLHSGDTIINDNNEKLRVLSQSSIQERGGVGIYALVREGTYESIKNHDYLKNK